MRARTMAKKETKSISNLRAIGGAGFKITGSVVLASIASAVISVIFPPIAPIIFATAALYSAIQVVKAGSTVYNNYKNAKDLTGSKSNEQIHNDGKGNLDENKRVESLTEELSNAIKDKVEKIVEREAEQENDKSLTKKLSGVLEKETREENKESKLSEQSQHNAQGSNMDVNNQENVNEKLSAGREKYSRITRSEARTKQGDGTFVNLVQGKDRNKCGEDAVRDR